MSVLSMRRRALLSSVDAGMTIVAQGKCGQSAYWKLYDTGEFEVYGSGEMYGYSPSRYPEFYGYREEVYHITVKEGITGSIGDFLFYGFTNLTLIDFPSDITSIGDYAFYDCPKLALTEFPSGITRIGSQAFWRCSSITSVTFHSKPTLYTNSFADCGNLNNIYVPWAEGEVSGAPWGASNATIHYNTVYEENGNPITEE